MVGATSTGHVDNPLEIAKNDSGRIVDEHPAGEPWNVPQANVPEPLDNPYNPHDRLVNNLLRATGCLLNEHNNQHIVSPSEGQHFVPETDPAPDEDNSSSPRFYFMNDSEKKPDVFFPALQEEEQGPAAAGGDVSSPRNGEVASYSTSQASFPSIRSGSVGATITVPGSGDLAKAHPRAHARALASVAYDYRVKEINERLERDGPR